MKVHSLILLSLLPLLSSVNGLAQLNLPADEALSSQAQNHYALFIDHYKGDKYPVARKHFSWLIHETPAIHESIYINGIKMYSALASDEANTKAEIHQDSVLILYDLRIKHFNNEKEQMDRKASAAYNYLRSRQERVDELFAIFERTYELNGKDVGVNNLATYMDVTRKYHLHQPLSQGEILMRYFRVIDAIDYKEKQQDEEGKYDKVRALATKILLEIIDVTCDLIKQDLAPRMKTDPSMAPRIISLSLSQQCTSEPYFEEAVEIFIKEKPDYTLIRYAALKAAERGETEKAYAYFNQAIELTQDASKKAQIYLDMATIESKLGHKAEARKKAEKALSIDPKLSKAYKLIGDLYFMSINDCKKEQSQVEDRAIYWAAYDMYQKAGDTDAMNKAAEQFPTISDIFTEDREEGQMIEVKCWINTTTTIRRRKE